MTNDISTTIPLKKPVRITSYRVDTWLNKATNEAMYGVSVKIDGYKGWVRVAHEGAAVIRDTKTSAETYIAGMKRERDSRGFKIAPATEELRA